MISCHNLCVGRWRRPVARSLTGVVLVLWSWRGSRRGARCASGPVVHVALGLGLSGELGLALVVVAWVMLALGLPVGAGNEDIDAAVLGVYGALVVIIGFGEFSDDVPGVKEAGNVSEDEEEKVDY